MNGNRAAMKVAYPAILGALSLVLVYLGSIAPSGNWGIVAVAGLLPAAVVISAGFKAGLLCWGGVSLLAFILIPGKFCALMYAVLFGLYPIVKSLIERLRRRLPEYLLKLVFFNGAFTVLYLTMKAAVLESLPTALSTVWVLYLVGNVVFLVYDFGFSRLISLYIARIHRVVR